MCPIYLQTKCGIILQYKLVIIEHYLILLIKQTTRDFVLLLEFDRSTAVHPLLYISTS